MKKISVLQHALYLGLLLGSATVCAKHNKKQQNQNTEKVDVQQTGTHNIKTEEISLQQTPSDEDFFEGYEGPVRSTITRPWWQRAGARMIFGTIWAYEACSHKMATVCAALYRWMNRDSKN